jgi:ATP-dependent Clp protease ATP-binding subunit ClpA
MFDRFSETAIKAIVIAQDEATKLGQGFVGTEMILLGLLHAEGSVAAAALRCHSVSFEEAQTCKLEVASSLLTLFEKRADSKIRWLWTQTN